MVKLKLTGPNCRGNVSGPLRARNLLGLVVIYWWADMYLTAGLSLRKKKVDY